MPFLYRNITSRQSPLESDVSHLYILKYLEAKKTYQLSLIRYYPFINISLSQVSPPATLSFKIMSDFIQMLCKHHYRRTILYMTKSHFYLLLLVWLVVTVFSCSHVFWQVYHESWMFQFAFMFIERHAIGVMSRQICPKLFSKMVFFFFLPQKILLTQEIITNTTTCNLPCKFCYWSCGFYQPLTSSCLSVSQLSRI